MDVDPIANLDNFFSYLTIFKFKDIIRVDNFSSVDNLWILKILITLV